MAFNAIRYKWKRYLFLVLGLSLGFALILLLTGLAGAMKQNVTEPRPAITEETFLSLGIKRAHTTRRSSATTQRSWSR